MFARKQLENEMGKRKRYIKKPDWTEEDLQMFCEIGVAEFAEEYTKPEAMSLARCFIYISQRAGEKEKAQLYLAMLLKLSEPLDIQDEDWKVFYKVWRPESNLMNVNVI